MSERFRDSGEFELSEKERFQKLVEHYATQAWDPEHEDDIVLFGSYHVPASGPMHFDGIDFLRKVFIVPDSPTQDFYYADYIRVTMAESVLYEICYDHYSGSFSQPEVGGGSSAFEVVDDTMLHRDYAGRQMVEWVESVALDLVAKDGDPDEEMGRHLRLV